MNIAGAMRHIGFGSGALPESSGDWVVRYPGVNPIGQWFINGNNVDAMGNFGDVVLNNDNNCLTLSYLEDTAKFKRNVALLEDSWSTEHNYFSSNKTSGYLPCNAEPWSIMTFIKTGNTGIIIGGNVVYGYINSAGCLGCIEGETIHVAGTVKINDNVWRHIAIIYDGTQILVFADGVLVGSETIVLALKAWPTFTWSARADNSAYYLQMPSMRIFDTRFYDYATTQAQIQTICNIGA